MTTARFLAGVGLLLVALAPVALGARDLRGLLLPGWSGPPAWITDAVIVVGVLIGVAQVLGTIGAFDLVPLVLGCMASGAAVSIVARGRIASSADAPPPVTPVPRLAMVVALASCAVVLAAWTPRVTLAFDRGMTSPDTIWQHLPAAARFVQEGSIRDLQYFDAEPFSVFYPLNSSLLHAEGMLLFGSDVLSPLLNIGWLALALLAAWCIGRPWGVGPACVTGVALVLASPILVTTQPGGAYNDVVVIALILVAIALLANGGASPRPVALAALAAGLAVGTKFTAVPTATALSLAVLVLAPKGDRVRVAALWTAVLVAAGGFWYARNLAWTGSPLPAFTFDFGLFSLPSVQELTVPRFRIASYLGDPDARSGVIEPALEFNFGPAWSGIVGLAVVGTVASLASRDRFARVLGFVAAVSLIAYLFTPLVLGTEELPFLFKYNVRYVTLALAVGLVALACRPWLREGWRQWLVLAVLAVLLIATQTDTQLWPTAYGSTGIAIGAVAFAAMAIAILSGRRRPPRALGLTAAATGIVAFAAGGAFVQHDYLRDRYSRAAALRFQLSSTGEYAEWAQDLSHARIAIVGEFLTYPFYGRDLTNHVEFLGERLAHGGFSPIITCSKWRAALNDGSYDYVVTAPLGETKETPPAETWTRSDPAASKIRSNPVAKAGYAALFRLTGPMHPASCPRPPRALISRAGHRSLLLASGAEVPVRAGAVAGFLESVRGVDGGVVLSGWATDPGRRRPATRILVVDGGRRLASEIPTGSRPDIAERYGPSAIRSGFRVTIRDPRGSRLAEPGRLEVYATTARAATKLPSIPATDP